MYSTQLSYFGWAILVFSLGAIALYVVANIIAFVSGKDIVSNQKRIITICFFFGVIAMAFLWDPADYYDLYRHFYYLDQIRASNMSFMEFVFGNTTAIGGAAYKNLYFFNILRYLIAKLSNNNHLLPGFCALADYCVFYYISTDWIKENNYSDRWLFPIILIDFSLMPYLLVVSGVRNAFAASLVALAIYRRICKDATIVEFAILSVIAITFHQSVIVAIGLALMYPLFKGIKGSVFILVIAIALSQIAQLLVTYGGSFLRSLGSAYLFYSETKVYHGEALSYWTDIVVLLAFICMYFRNPQIVEKNKICAFVQVYMVFTLACSTAASYNVLLRTGYLLAPLACILFMPYIKSNSERKNKYFDIALLIIALVACGVNIIDDLWKFFAQMF